MPARLKKVRQDYDRMLEVLHERAPHAKILAVGHPTVIPRDTSSCDFGDLTQFGTITQGDLERLRDDVLEPLNKAISDSTGTQDAADFVDIHASSRNHSVCDDSKWVEGFVTLPDRLSFVHPNALGHRNAADHVEEAMLNTLS
ncbi:GDSL-type esterase/lipase family protein [Streptomyces sp. NPDC000931]|uniref:GDSL-type esterase/lipase family protein n=1 Tax=Streptomyces sp. NPDC000931 TaxID=3154372 RepID=UPI00331F556C